MDLDTAYVLFPIMATIIAVAAFFVVIRAHNGGQIPIFEIGVFYISLVAVYAILPLLTFLANGKQYSAYNEDRLYYSQPNSEMVGTVAWYYVIYLAAFAVGYLLVRGKTRGERVYAGRFSPPVMWGLLTVYLVIHCYLIALTMFYDLSASNYADTYTVLNRLPQELRQITGHLAGMLIVLKLMLLTCFFHDFKKNRLLIVLLVGIELASLLRNLGSRLDAMFLLIASVMLYHFLVQKLDYFIAITYGAVVMAAFMLVGFFRADMADNKSSRGEWYCKCGEFEAVFSNVHDIYVKTKQGGCEVPSRVILSEYLFFIPQQFLPFDKLTYSQWYVDTYYRWVADGGGGFDFGIIPQAMTGYGAPDLALRGFLLGAVLAIIHRRHSNTILGLVSYVYIAIISYNSFRASMLNPLYLYMFRFFPVYFMIVVFGGTILPRTDSRADPVRRPSAREGWGSAPMMTMNNQGAGQ